MNFRLPGGFSCCAFKDSSSVVVDSLFIVASIVWGFILCLVLVLYVLSSFAIICLRERELVALLLCLPDV